MDKSENPVIPSILHHRQNRLEPNRINLLTELHKDRPVICSPYHVCLYIISKETDFDFGGTLIGTPAILSEFFWFSSILPDKC
jgi:hypothetical protein